MRKIILSALAIAAIASCSKTELNVGGDTSNAIVFGGSIETETKRADDAVVFDNGEIIGVFGYSMATAAPTTDFTAGLFLDNVPFTYDGTQFTSTPTYMWQSGKAHNFYAYYPTTLTLTDSDAGATTPLEVVALTGIDAANDIMVAQKETAIYDGSQRSVELKFRHVLSKVRFLIKKGSVTAPDAELSNIEFKMKSDAGVVNLMTGAVTNTPDILRLSRDLSEAPVTVTSTTAVEVPGDWMVLPLDEISGIAMTINGKLMTGTDVNAIITTQPGKITTITIIATDNSITFTSEIDPWGEDPRDGNVKPMSSGQILMYRKFPYHQTGTIAASTTVTHNDKHGVGDTNGKYYTEDAPAYTGEPPYYRFEVAKSDVHIGTGSLVDWRDLQGVRADRSDNICVQMQGAGWRLPRLSELRLMYENRTALNISGKDFTPLTADSYWSATEASYTITWCIYFGDGTAWGGVKSSTRASVRCIKELPAPPPPSAPLVLEYSKPPYSQVGTVLKGFTYVSYNGRYGSGANNGLYRAYVTNAYVGDRAFYKFEVAAEDAYNGGLNNKSWAALQGTASNHSDNICVTTHGAGWRLPRLSEMRLMYENRDALNSYFGFYYAIAGPYWSATEGSASTAWSINLVDGTASNGNKTLTNYGVRCVKELAAPVLEPVIVEYGKPPYNQVGTLLKGYTPISYNVLHGAGTTTNGYVGSDVYISDKPYAKFEVAREDAYNGVDNNKGWAALQGTASDRSDNICEKTHGEGWRLPRLSEMRLIYENRVALNERFGSNFAIADTYWSATEYTADQAWRVDFAYGGATAFVKWHLNHNVRCIKELVPVLEPIIVDYGTPPYNLTGTMPKGYTLISYNVLHGAGTTTNGAYRADADAAYLNEQPYVKFEVAIEDAYDRVIRYQDWAAIQGTAPDRSDNICEKTYGEGWRLPRLSELRLIYENRVELNKRLGSNFAFSDDYYWSATESNDRNALVVNLVDGNTGGYPKTYTAKVRCVKEIPNARPVIEYSKPPYAGIGSVLIATKTSYNDKYGWGASNGDYQASEIDAVAYEHPYYKFEVAQKDAYARGGGKYWHIMQGSAPVPDRSDNICVMTHGEGWRIPRLQELVLIYANKSGLNASGNGFTALKDNLYWSATESRNNYVWTLYFLRGESTAASWYEDNYVRCIRELP